MATITQLPAPLNIQSVAGSPFSITVNVTLTDENGDPIPWVDVTDPVATVSDVSRSSVAEVVPTITSPQAGQWVIAWTAGQTTIIGQDARLSWSIAATIEGTGPLTLMAGTLTMVPSTTTSS